MKARQWASQQQLMYSSTSGMLGQQRPNNMIDVDLFGSTQKLQRMRACLKSYSSASGRAIAAGYMEHVKDLNKVCSGGT
jgi:hypothetical protein